MKVTSLRITIESTATLTTVEGVPVRLWEGRTDSGIPCRVFVRLIAVRDDEDQAVFARELAERLPPWELAIPLAMVLEGQGIGDGDGR